jgi:23S rRNA pseudouridine2605 synthase
MDEIRLQKYLANCGIASRRKCEELIINGLVRVNEK